MFVRTAIHILLRALLAAPLLAGCHAPPPRTTWRDDMVELFGKSSVRPDDPPRHMWNEADVDLLQRRLGYADCAAVGTTRVVTTFSTFSNAKQLALAFHPEQMIYGSLDDDLDRDGDLVMQLTPAQNDFRLAIQLQRLLPGTRYLLFLKRQPGQPPVWHWALYRDDAQLIQEVRATYEILKRDHERGADKTTKAEKRE
jgi:hypothetical protein